MSEKRVLIKWLNFSYLLHNLCGSLRGTTSAKFHRGIFFSLFTIITLRVTLLCMIKSFKHKETEKLYLTGRSRKFDIAVCKIGLRKLDYLNASHSLNDLKLPPGNNLEALLGDY